MAPSNADSPKKMTPCPGGFQNKRGNSEGKWILRFQGGRGVGVVGISILIRRVQLPSIAGAASNDVCLFASSRSVWFESRAPQPTGLSHFAPPPPPHTVPSV
ncbi:hypothetical protein CDAR_319011 [Caerostris darwini]|uniref:Uncharacterized protein n=1 Tax=Caerostris darwini TaxID=1538125 RepID=A0AAV4TUG0_9ARAC|nr:hypothetical protein CDAR_319011 [Caerostris darwini]